MSSLYVISEGTDQRFTLLCLVLALQQQEWWNITKHTPVSGELSVKWDPQIVRKARMNGANVRYPQIHVHKYTFTPKYLKVIFKLYIMALLCVP